MMRRRSNNFIMYDVAMSIFNQYNTRKYNIMVFEIYIVRIFCTRVGVFGVVWVEYYVH